MFNSISHSGIYVLDQDEAIDFYVGKLGLEVSGSPSACRGTPITTSCCSGPARR
jgi:hypothetical protein